jgi:hypothetical protein
MRRGKTRTLDSMGNVALKLAIGLCALVAAIPVAFIAFFTWVVFGDLDVNRWWALGFAAWWAGFIGAVLFARSYGAAASQRWKNAILLVLLLLGVSGIGFLEVLAWNDRKGVIPPGLFAIPYVAALAAAALARMLSNSTLEREARKSGARPSA